MRQHRVQGGLKRRRISSDLGEQQTALNRRQCGKRQTVGVGVGAQFAAIVHGLEPASDRGFPLTKTTAEIGACLGPGLGEFARKGPDRAATPTVPLPLQSDDMIAPGMEGVETIQMREVRLLGGEHCLGLVGDDGTNQCLLIAEVMVELRGAHACRIPHILGARPGHAVLED